MQGDYPYSMATVNISNCTFEGNYAANGSGIYVTGVYELLVERSLFIDNWALDAGGVAFGGGANISSLVTAVLRECNFTGGWSCSGGGGKRTHYIHNLYQSIVRSINTSSTRLSRQESPSTRRRDQTLYWVW